MRQLNIGSGSYPLDGYDNADIDPTCPGLAFVCAMDAVPCEDGTYDKVRAQHCIEHVPFAAGKIALAEWFRVLKSGGTVWIDTPNLARNARNYLIGDAWLQDFRYCTLEEQERCSVDGVPNRTLHANFKMFSTDKQYDVHFCNYDAELLTMFLKRTGFTNCKIEQTEPSLIITAVKP